MKMIQAEAFNAALRERHLTIVCAESITAGLLASTIASVSGASDVLIGSIVTYSRKLKTAVLGVDAVIIDQYTAESMETTREMAYGLTRIYPAADIFVAVTGVASKPTNDYYVDKPVGQVYVAVYYQGKMHKREIVVVASERNERREKAVAFIFEVVLEIIGG